MHAPDRGKLDMAAIAGIAFAAVAVLAVALQYPKAAAAFGALAYWLVAHGV
jgi:hypothetical protein